MSDELSPRSDSGEELKLKEDEVLNLVSDERELQKKLDLEEEQEILAAAEEALKAEEEKVPLEVLQKKPEEITKMLEEQFIKEIEQAAAKDGKAGNRKEEGKAPLWKWWWGRLPEKTPEAQNIEKAKETNKAVASSA